MTRFRVLSLVALLVLGAATFAAATHAGSSDDSGAKRIAIEDDCDPNDPAWGPVGGCMHERGDVNFAEFGAEMTPPLSLLSTAVIGHQAWRMAPAYLKVKAGKTVRIENEGGRPHTFTEVARFGGGKVGGPVGGLLNKGLTTAPECPGSIDLAAGDRVELSGLTVGDHRFVCCIHPWMRAMIKVKPDGGGDDDD
jgi:plastocyanin